MTVSDLLPFKVTIVGGSYAGLSVLQNVLRLNNGQPLIQALPPGNVPEVPQDARVHRGIHITLIDERDGFFNTIGAPLAHVARPFVNPFWRRFLDIKALRRPDITILHASLKHVDLGERRLTVTEVATRLSRTESYDYLVLATGLKRDFPIVPSALSKDEYLRAAQEHVDTIESAKGGTAVVLGGGKMQFSLSLATRQNSEI
jgi:NADPH-dependent 2,4-dienoyl-CoA reductase/sulfur reductase-like enzyme